MAGEEPMRALRARLEEILGKEHALTLIARLPGEEPATKADFEVLRADFEVLRADVHAVKADLEAMGAALQVMRADQERFPTKDDQTRFPTKDDLTRFATKDDLTRFATKDELKRFATKDDLRVMGAELRVAMADGFAAQTRTFIMATIGALITVGGLAVAAAKF